MMKAGGMAIGKVCLGDEGGRRKDDGLGGGGWGGFVDWRYGYLEGLGC